MSTKTFLFTFEASNEFLRHSPVADEYVEAKKRRIAAQTSALGPRGGLYRLVTPPDKWRESQDHPWAFTRNVTLFATRREGKYVRPDRITPDMILGDTLTFVTLTAPVIGGRAVLPDGGTVTTTSKYVDFPVA